MRVRVTRLVPALIVMTLVMLLLDLTWLGVVMKDFYDSNLGSLRAVTVNWVAAALFYVLYLSLTAGAALLSSSPRKAAFHGAVIGFYTYGVYELTNWAVIEDWPAAMVLPDWIWGIVLTSAVVTSGHIVYYGSGGRLKANRQTASDS